MPPSLVHRVYLNVFQGTAFLNTLRPEQYLQVNPNVTEQFN